MVCGFSCLVRDRGSNTTRLWMSSHPPAAPVASVSTLHTHMPTSAPSSPWAGQCQVAATCPWLPKPLGLAGGLPSQLPCIYTRASQSNPTIHIHILKQWPEESDRQDMCSWTSPQHQLLRECGLRMKLCPFQGQNSHGTVLRAVPCRPVPD